LSGGFTKSPAQFAELFVETFVPPFTIIVFFWKNSSCIGKKRVHLSHFTLENSSLASLLLALPLNQQHITWTHRADTIHIHQDGLLMPFGSPAERRS